MKNFLAFVVVVFSLTALASGVSVKGGGSGVDLNDHVVLLDLLESGVDHDPYFGSRSCAGVSFEAISSLALESSGLSELVCRKIYDVASLDTALATAMSKTLASLTWVFTDGNLKTIDADPIIDVSPVQLAVRNGNRVIINRALFKRMPSTHQAALVIHEIAAALISAEVTSPLPVRTLVGNLFRQDYFSRAGHDLLNDLRYFPSRREIIFTYEGWKHVPLPPDSIETPFSVSEGTLFYPSLTTIWTDAKGKTRSMEAFYAYDQTKSQVDEVLNYCDHQRAERRLLQLGVTYLSATVLARVQLENGTPTDRYDFHAGYEMKSMIQLPTKKPEACSDATRSSLNEVRTWLSKFKPVPLL